MLPRAYSLWLRNIITWGRPSERDWLLVSINFCFFKGLLLEASYEILSLMLMLYLQYLICIYFHNLLFSLSILLAFCLYLCFIVSLIHFLPITYLQQFSLSCHWSSSLFNLQCITKYPAFCNLMFFSPLFNPVF